MTDTFNLQRFVDAQAPAYDRALRELKAGRKQTHWMWFIFPQIAGLGRSATAQKYAIASAAEAEAYLNHPVLGPRLIECCETINALEGKSAASIFGSIDTLKLRSSLTLFGAVDPDSNVIRKSLQKYFAGEADNRTLDLLN